MMTIIYFYVGPNKCIWKGLVEEIISQEMICLFWLQKLLKITKNYTEQRKEEENT